MKKKIYSILLIVLSVLLIASCSTVKTVETLTPVVEQTATMEQPLVKEETVAEPVPVEPVAEEPAKVVPPVIVVEPENREIKASYTYNGYGLDVVLGEGSGYITYPTVLTKEDLASFLSFVQSKYSSYLNGITYSLDGNRINLTYPKSFGEAEAAVAEQLFLTAFDSYIKKITTPVVEEPVIVEKTVAEPVVEEPELFYKTYDFYGYPLDFYATNGYAILTYPSIFTADEVFNALVEISEEYEEYLKDITISVYGDAIEFVFPESYGLKEFSLAEQIISTELINYIEKVVAGYLKATAEPVQAEPVIVEKTVAVSEPVKVEPVIIVEPENRDIKAQYSYNGYVLDVVLGEGSGYITYPTVLTKEDLASFLSFIQSKYSSYLNGITYSLDGNRINLTYPKSFGEAEAAVAEQLFLTAFDSYIKMIAPGAEKPTVTKSVPVEPVVEESVPAVVEPAKTETVKVSEPVVDPTPEKVETPKKSASISVVLIIIIILLVAAVAIFVVTYRKKDRH